MSGVVDHGGEGSSTDSWGSSVGGKSWGSSVGKSWGSVVGSVASDSWGSITMSIGECVVGGVRVSGVGDGSVVCEHTTLGAGPDSSDLSEVSVAGLYDLRGVLHGSGSNGQNNLGGEGYSGSNGQSVGSYTESSTVSDVVGLDNLSVGVNIRVRSSYIAEGIAHGVVNLSGVGIAVASLSQLILSVVLGLGDSGYSGVYNWSSRVCYWGGSGVGGCYLGSGIGVSSVVSVVVSQSGVCQARVSQVVVEAGISGVVCQRSDDTGLGESHSGKGGENKLKINNENRKPQSRNCN